MKLEEFINKYEGKGIDYDGAYGAQCVDLYRQYVKEVLGFPQSPPVPGAKDIWDTYLPEYYKRVENTPYGVPDRGDIIIFGTGLGKWGHVAIFLEGNASRFTSLDQNYPTGSLVHKQGHTYNAVLGWLKPIKEEMNITDQTIIPQIKSPNGDPMEVQAIRSELYDKRRVAQDQENQLNELKGKYETTNESLSKKADEVNELNNKIDELKREKAEVQDLFDKARNERDQALREAYKVQPLEKLVEELQTENEKLRQEGIGGLSRWELFLLFLRGGDKT